MFIKVVMDPPQSDQPSATQDNTPQHHGAIQSPECILTTEQHHYSQDSPETVEQAHIQHHVPPQEENNGTIHLQNTVYSPHMAEIYIFYFN